MANHWFKVIKHPAPPRPGPKPRFFRSDGKWVCLAPGDLTEHERNLLTVFILHLNHVSRPALGLGE